MATAKTKKKQVIDKNFQKKRNAIVAVSKDMKEEMLAELLDKFPEHLEERATEFSKELSKYIDSHSEAGAYMPEDVTKIPLFEITQHAFKPFIRVPGACPYYSASQMSIAFDYFAKCVIKLNEYYTYVPKKSDFCRMLNISTHKFSEYKNSNDEEMREICYMIEDFCSSIVDDAALNGRVEKTYAIFHQKFSNDRRDNDPVVNNTFVQNNNIMSDKEINDLMKKYLTE